MAPQPGSLCVPLDWIDACGGDHLAAVVLHQIHQWTNDTTYAQRVIRADGEWLTPTDKDWHAAARLDDTQLRRAISVLHRRGLLLHGRWKVTGDPDPHRHVRLANPTAPTVSVLPTSQPSLLDPPAEPAAPADAERLAEAERLCNLLADLVASHGVNRPRVTPAWIKEMERLLRIDGREPANVEKAIRWVQSDSFWASNVMSPAKLREQYSRLQLEARSRRGANRGQTATHRPAAGADLAESYQRVAAS